MKRLKKYFAISRTTWLMLIAVSAPAFAGEVVASVTQASGPLLVKRLNGSIKALSVGSLVELGDLLVSERSTSATFQTANGRVFSIQPDTQLKVDSNLFNAPSAPAAIPSVQQVKAAPAAGAALRPNSPGGSPAPGLYVHVIDGTIQLTNKGGTQQFAAGQFGFTPSLIQPPVVLPTNSGIRFTPPPAYHSQGAQANAAVDCEVR